MKYLKKFEGIDDVSKLSGWVNIKIDKQLFIRMAKYVNVLDDVINDERFKYNLFYKIDQLSNIDKIIDNEKVSIQSKVSIITLLQYFNELRHQFNASTAGFLLEGFLAALIHGQAPDNFSATDVTSKRTDISDEVFDYEDIPAPQFLIPIGTSKKIKYQIKLYKKGNNIKINWDENNLCDFYVICLKNGDKIDIHILTSDPNDSQTYVKNFMVKPTELTIQKRKEAEESYLRDNNKPLPPPRFIEINTNKLYTRKLKNEFMRTLDISTSKIEGLIQRCGDNVKDSITNIYTQLSELHYDVDSLVTGMDKNKNKISIETATKSANNTIQNITNDISNFSSISGL
jgi:hypothetical protein